MILLMLPIMIEFHFFIFVCIQARVPGGLPVIRPGFRLNQTRHNDWAGGAGTKQDNL